MRSAAMPPEHDVTHRDLWVKIAELGGKVDSILQLMAERKEDVARITKDLDALFSRQRLLENRMAQIAILGICAAVIIPAAATIWAGMVAAPSARTFQPELRR